MLCFSGCRRDMRGDKLKVIHHLFLQSHVESRQKLTWLGGEEAQLGMLFLASDVELLHWCNNILSSCTFCQKVFFSGQGSI